MTWTQQPSASPGWSVQHPDFQLWAKDSPQIEITYWDVNQTVWDFLQLGVRTYWDTALVPTFRWTKQ